MAGRFASSLSLLAATLLGSFRFVRFRAWSRYRRKRIRESGSQAASRRGAKSRRFAIASKVSFCSKDFAGTLCFLSHFSNILCASLTGFRSALRYCAATTVYALPVLTPLWWQDWWRSPLLVLVLGLFCVGFWFCVHVVHRLPAIFASCSLDQDSSCWPCGGFCSLSVPHCHFHLASAGLVGFLCLFSCLCLDGLTVPSEAIWESASSGHGSLVEARASLWPMPGAFFFGKHFLLHWSPHLPLNLYSLFGPLCLFLGLLWELCSCGGGEEEEGGSLSVAPFGSSASLSHVLVCFGGSCTVSP